MNMDEPVSAEGDIKKTYREPFRFLEDGDGTADNPGVRIKCRFILIPNSDESKLDSIIMRNGGDVLDDFSTEADAEYAVTLLDEGYYLKYSTKNCNLPPDTFSCGFVGDAIKSARNSLPLPDLNKYRLTPSKYSPYDPNQILRQRLKWSDLIPLDKPPSEKFTAKQVIAAYSAADSSFKTHYQELRKTEMGATNEKRLPVIIDTVQVSEVVQRYQTPSKPEDRKQSSKSCTKINGPAEKVLGDNEQDSNKTTKTTASASLKRTPDMTKSTENSTTQQEAASKLPESIQSTDQPSPSRNHRSENLPSPGTGNEDDSLANDKDNAEAVPALTKPHSDQTDQIVLNQPSRKVTPTPRKRRSVSASDLQTTEEEADSDLSDSPPLINGSKSKLPTPVKLVPHPVLGDTPPRVKRPKLVQRLFAGPSSTMSSSKSPSPSTSKAAKSSDNATVTRGKHDGWISDDEDEDVVNGNDNNIDNDSSEYSLSEGESNMFKRPKLVPKAFAGPQRTKPKKKSVQKAHVPRSTNSIAKAQVGYDNDDGFISTDVSYDDVDDDNMSVSSTSSTASARIRKGPKLPFSRNEGQKILSLVCEKKAFMYTKGNRLWQQMEDSGLFPGRTHQSLKEHWRKKVLPNALKNTMYEIKPEDLTRLKKDQARMKWSQHANICPDFKF